MGMNANSKQSDLAKELLFNKEKKPTENSIHKGRDRI